MYNVTVNGIVHRSLEAACRATNIKVSTIRYWLDLGFTREEAFNQVSAMIESRKVTVFGETYPSFTDCCNARNKNRKTVVSRIGKGKTIEQAFM